MLSNLSVKTKKLSEPFWQETFKISKKCSLKKSNFSLKPLKRPFMSSTDKSRVTSHSTNSKLSLKTGGSRPKKRMCNSSSTGWMQTETRRLQLWTWKLQLASKSSLKSSSFSGKMLPWVVIGVALTKTAGKTTATTSSLSIVHCIRRLSEILRTPFLRTYLFRCQSKIGAASWVS